MTVSVHLPSTMTPMGRAVSQPTPFVKFAPVVDDLIDPMTGDYGSLIKNMNPIDSQVVIALKTTKGEGAAVENVGNSLATIKKITPTTARLVEGEIRTALARLVKNGDIRIVSVDVEALPGYQQVNASLRYQNLRAGTEPSIKLVITT